VSDEAVLEWAKELKNGDDENDLKFLELCQECIDWLIKEDESEKEEEESEENSENDSDE
jgi:hypothetical protein